jgi:hypothetical protein
VNGRSNHPAYDGRGDWLVPGFLAVLTIGLLVREKTNNRAATGSFCFGVRQLPPPFRKFLLAVGIFGLGDFSHTLLILFATQALTPFHGKQWPLASLLGSICCTTSSTPHSLIVAVGSQTTFRNGKQFSSRLRNGLIDGGPSRVRSEERAVAGSGFCTRRNSRWSSGSAGRFAYRRTRPASAARMGFGTLAAVNAVGDFISSSAIGLLWSAVSASIAFGLSGLLFLLGAVLVLRVR